MYTVEISFAVTSKLSARHKRTRCKPHLILILKKNLPVGLFSRCIDAASSQGHMTDKFVLGFLGEFAGKLVTLRSHILSISQFCTVSFSEGTTPSFDFLFWCPCGHEKILVLIKRP